MLVPIATALALYAFYALVIGPLIFPDPAVRYFKTQKLVGEPKGLFSKIRSSLAALTKMRSFVHEGYDEYSKKNQTFALPRFGTAPTVLLPLSKIQTMIHQPETTVSQKLVLHDFVQTVTGDHDLQVNPIHIDLIRNQLTRKLPMITNEVYEELVLAFKDYWPVSKGEWTTFKAVDTCTKIVSRAANRAFCGAELCRNSELLDHIGEYAHSMFIGVGVVGMLPFFLRPILAPIIVRPAKKHLEIVKKLAVPVIQRRLDQLRSGKPPVPTGDISDNTNDALQWLIEECVKKNDPAELDPVRICRRIVRVNMVAIHTTSTTITNTLLDLYSSPHRAEIVEGLREEVSRVLAAAGGTWTKAAVNDLHRIDSTIKESMRKSGIFIAGMTRVIADTNGVDFGDGIHVPYGVRVATPNCAIHMDPQNYESPDTFDAFRFSRARESLATSTDAAAKTSNLIALTSQAAVTTSDKFLSFGHGRGACPGRFFASQEMKLMLAHIVMTYDLRVAERPKNRDFGAMSIPVGAATLEVKLRD